MGASSPVAKAENLFEDFSNPEWYRRTGAGVEKYWRWPREVGRGFMYMMKLRDGFFLGVGDYLLTQHITVDFKLDFPSVVFGFNFLGNLNIDFRNGENREPPRPFRQGDSFITYMSRWQGAAEYPVGVPVRAVGIYIAPPLLMQMLTPDHGQVPDLSSIIHGGGEFYYRSTEMTDVISDAVFQILRCSYALPLKKVYLEGKALELMSLSMRHHLSSESDLPGVGGLPAEDLNRIRRAEKVLLQHLDEPPSLPELAKRVGINKNKLNRGFRQVFGASVFNHLRTLRLEKARDLLENRQRSVTEAAFDVGYTHQQNFSRAFKNHFGTNPKDHLR